MEVADASQRTKQPMVMGASVLAIKYADGVMMTSDTLGSYGSMAMFKNVQRIRKVNESTLLGGSGDYSDFQHVTELLHELTLSDFCHADGRSKSCKEIFTYLSRVMYARRSKIDPLWNQLVIAGHDQGKSFLGMVDLYGSCFEENVVATGFGAYLAAPLLRKGWRPDLTEVEAKKLLDDAMTVLFYRHTRTINKIQCGKVTKEEVTVSQPYSLPTCWEHRRFVDPAVSD